MLDSVEKTAAGPIAVSVRAFCVATVLALTPLQLAAQEPKVVIFNDGTVLEVNAVELQGRVLVLRTNEGRRQIVPRALVDEAATGRTNPGLFALQIPADSDLEPAQPRLDEQRMPVLGGAQPATGDTPESEALSTEHEMMVEHVGDMGHGASRLSAAPMALALEQFPERPKPLLELGSPFLGTGPIGRGFRIPGGAIWQPSFLLFGTFQSVLSATDNELTRTNRWANRLDLFGNIYLSQTERILFGLRPLDETNAQGGRSFSGYTSFDPDPINLSGSNDHSNFDSDTVSHLFFEGEFGELFPRLDDNDRRSMDFGLSFGRQPINFQEGLLINDSVDAIGITRNNLKSGGTVSHRITGLFAWNEINRNTGTTSSLIRNAEADSARMIGIFSEIDWRATTVSIDAIYVAGGTFQVEDQNGDLVAREAGDGFYFGAGFVQRFGAVNTAVRILGSMPVGDEVPVQNTPQFGDPADKGLLVFAETSWTSHGNHNFSYVNAFYAIDSFRAAALDPNLQGPLARSGILFAGSTVGDPGAISSEASDTWGGAVGRQWFFSGSRQQLVVEAGLRYSTQECTVTIAVCIPDTVAGGVRYQIAFGRRGIVVLDGYVAYDQERSVAGIEQTASRARIGGRVELITKF